MKPSGFNTNLAVGFKTFSDKNVDITKTMIKLPIIKGEGDKTKIGDSLVSSHFAPTPVRSGSFRSLN